VAELKHNKGRLGPAKCNHLLATIDSKVQKLNMLRQALFLVSYELKKAELKRQAGKQKH